MFPKHISLHIEHNPHVEDGQDAATWLDEERQFFGASFPDEHFAQMVTANEVWIIRWLVEPGDAGHAVFAHSWEAALERANATDIKSA